MKLFAEKLALSPWHERYVHQSRRACSSASNRPRLAAEREAIG